MNRMRFRFQDLRLVLLLVSLTFFSFQEGMMKKTNQLYTMGHWTAKAGRESEFRAEWEAFARWTGKNQPGAGVAYLLRDNEHPQKFVSFGPWESAEAIKAWRERPEFKAYVGKLRELCEDFQPQSLTAVASSAE